MAENEDLQKMVRVLEEIRDNQKRQMELQGKQFELAQRQMEKAEKIQGRAETLQAKSAQMMDAAKKVLMIAIPAIAVLLAYAGWLLLRRCFR